MNILVVCHYGLYEDLTFSFVHNQVREYAALGHRVRVIILNGMGKTGRDGKRLGKMLQKSNVEGVELCDLRYITAARYGEKHFNTQSAIAAVRFCFKELLENFAPDIIHAHALGFASEIGVYLKKKLGVPLVVTTHGSDTAVPYAQGNKAFLKTCCDRVDAVACVSSRLMAKLADCGVTIPLYSILNGFAVEHLTAAEKIPATWIQVGNLIPLKHADITIQALAAHRKAYPAAQLTIVGQGSERPKLETLCESLGISHAVSFTGVLPNRQVLEEMSGAQFFVMPSHPEGFGIVYLEAMANGCITIGTEGEGIADLIVSGENGFLVPPDDPDAIANIVDWCMKHPQDAVVIAERGRQAALSLTWEKNAVQYLKLFQTLI